MKIRVTLAVFVCLAIFLAFDFRQSVHGSSSQPPIGYTGAPGQGTCNTSGCHTGSSVVTNSSSITLSASPSLSNGYTPGTTYAITVTLASGNNRYGFSATVLNSSNNAIGTLARTNITNTSLQTNSGIQYIGHLNANSNRTWSFNWTAPASGSGIATFYVVGNFSNNNTSSSGDVIHTNSFSFSQSAGCPSISVNGTVGNATCNAGTNGSVNISPSGGAGPYTFLWSNNETTEDISGLSAGTYSVVATDANGCTGSASFTVTEPTALSLNANVNNVSCNGLCDGSITWSASGGNPPYTYSPSGANLSNLCASNYSVTVTDANGCSISASRTITQPTAVIINLLSFSDVSCAGACDGSFTWSAVGGSPPYTYNGTGGLTGTNWNNLCAGSYTLTVTDDNGCSVIAPQSIAEPDTLSITVTPTNTSCGACDGTGSATIQGGTPPYNYLWSNGATGQSIAGLCAGSYGGTVIDANGCSASTTLVVGTQNNLPTSAGSISGSATVCVGDTNAYAVTNTSGITYTWTVAGGTFTQIGNSITVVWTNAGNQAISVTPSNGCGNGPSSSLSVTVNNITAPPNAIVGDTIICVDEQVTFSSPSGTPQWTATGGAAVVPVGAGAAIVWDSAGTFTVSAYNMGQCGNSDTVSLLVDVFNPIVPVLKDTFACSNQNISLSPGSSFASYQWTGGSSLPSLAVTITGEYSVTTTDNNGCIASDTAFVEINPLPVINLPDTAIACDTVILDGTAGFGQYEWSTGDQLTTVFISAPFTGEASLTVTLSSGCIDSSSTYVEALPLPIASFSYNTNDLNVSFNDISQYAATYLWSFGDGDTSTQSSPSHTYAANGTYEVILTVANGCDTVTFADSVTVLGTGVSLAEGFNAAIYPNPVNEQLFLLTDIAARVNIMNALGETLISSETAPNQLLRIATNSLASGIYFVRLEHEGRTTIKKLVKQ
ncbi:MAG: choice-of-anchor V domain-containing protein [Chitinophagales bacterium]|nr:choice-of-anchor V domain-containing protein [Chitinophagales bacterium]